MSALKASAEKRSLFAIKEDEGAPNTNEAENASTELEALQTATGDPCVLEVAAKAGDKKLVVNNIRDRFKGESIVINKGGATEEVAVVAGFGSILLQSSLRHSHAVGEIIVTNKAQEGDTIETQLYKACEGTDQALLQVK